MSFFRQPKNLVVIFWPSDHPTLDIVLLRDLVYQTDLYGTEAAGKKGETVTVPKDIGRIIISQCDALYATSENVSYVQGDLEDGVEMSAEQQQLMRELSWLELESLSINFTAGSGWTVSPATIARRILVCTQIVIPKE